MGCVIGMSEKYGPRVIPNPVGFVPSKWQNIGFWVMLGVLTIGAYVAAAGIVVWVLRR